MIAKDIADKQADGQVYADDGYEDYDKESEETDNILSDPIPIELPKTSGDAFNAADWEDVDDDFE